MITSWDDVSISLYQEILALDFDDDYDINLLSLLSDISVDDLLEMDINKFEEMLNKIKFVIKPPKSYSKNILHIGDITLHKIELSKLTVGEFVDIENLLSGELSDNLSIILTIFYRVQTFDGDLLYKPELEEYGDWIYHRAKLFSDVKINNVYGAITSYINYRSNLFQSYSGLFKDVEDEDEIIEIENETPLEKKERLKVEEQDGMIKKWGWDTLILRLAGGDVLNIEDVTKLPIIGALNFLSIKKELDIE